MSEQRHLVFVSDEAWRLGVAPASGPVATAADATLEARAAAIKEHLAALGDVGSSVILALPSAWCLSATVSTEGLDRSSRRRAMGFCLEEHLPIAAEDVVADYVTADDGTAMGVCAEFVKLEAIVTALEAVGLRVRHVCPAALLSAAGRSALVVGGVLTELCVETTARAAFVRGVDVVVLGDGCGSADPGRHAASLAVLGFGFATVATCAEVEAAWAAGNGAG